jgi:hypothetical protein
MPFSPAIYLLFHKTMVTNLNKTDRTIRVIAAIGLLIFFAKTDESLPMNWLLLAGFLILLSTSLFSYCPLYGLLNLSTHRPKRNTPSTRKSTT